MAEASPRQSPMPAIRDRFRVPGNEVVETTLRVPLIQPESSVPIPSVPTPSRSPMPTPRNTQNRASESPHVRRRTEAPERPRNVPQTQSERARVEFSPTAQLLHKLFRNRDPNFLPDIAPLTPTSGRASSSRANPSPLPVSRQHHNEVIYTEIPSAPRPTASNDDGDDSGSEYLSIDNLSLTLNLENYRTDCVTPPPPYRSIFDDEK